MPYLGILGLKFENTIVIYLIVNFNAKIKMGIFGLEFKNTAVIIKISGLKFF